MSMLEENHVYSYSQLSSFEACPYGYYLAKIERVKQQENAFAQYGTLMHAILERWATGEIRKEDMLEAWETEYPCIVTEAWPKYLEKHHYAEKAYQAGVNYLTNFDEFKGYHVIAAEKKYETKIAGRRFVGIVDMLLEDEKTGELIILDHKSKSLAAFKTGADKMYKQILLYAKFILENVGRFPDKMMFNLFKEQQYQARPFSEEAYLKTLKWAEDTIERIESYDFIDFLQSTGEPFFCTNLCGVRDACPNGKAAPCKRRK